MPDPRVASILVIDDDDDDGTLIELAFSRLDHRCCVQRMMDPAEALRQLTMRSADRLRPDLILLDLRMPILSGQTVLDRLKADPTTASIPVVIFTNPGRPKDVADCYRRGASGFVVKPVGGEALNGIVADICHYWFEVNCLPHGE